MTHKKRGEIAVVGRVLRDCADGAVWVRWNEDSQETLAKSGAFARCFRPGDDVNWDGSLATVEGMQCSIHHTALYNIWVWDTRRQSRLFVAGIEGSALARPRSAAVLAQSRLKASAASGFVTAQPWRFSVPAGGWRMEKLCEVRVSSCPLIDSLGNNSGLGVWTVARVQAGTLLFWDMSRTRMVPYGKASLTELRYGVRKISRPRVVLLCPGGRGMQNLDNRTAIGIGFRVNFAASAPHANVQLQHGGYQGAGLCFRVMQDLGPSLELLFLQQPALG